MWVEHLVEYQQWGLNALTVSFLISIGITLITGWGLLQQNRTIWSEKRAEAVSIFWLAYNFALQLAIFIYGFSIQSGALLLNGLLALPYIPILIGLQKFKGFSRGEIISIGLLGAALVAMVLLPLKATFFFVLAMGGLVSALTQPMEMRRKKSAQGLNIKLIGILLLGNIAWFSYGVAVGDWVLVVANLLAFCIFGTTAALYWQYSPRKL